MHKIFQQIILALSLLTLAACSGQSSKQKVDKKETLATGTEIIDTDDILANKILTEEDQKKLHPDQVLQILKEGNEDFMQDRLTIRNTSARIRAAAVSQFPKAVILSCLDSRVPVEDIFHRGIGDVFVARIAGNIVNEDIVGSMEYGCKVSGAKLLLVLGHENCGAIKSAIDNVHLGNITNLLAKIKPAVTAVKGFENQTSKNSQFVHAVCEENIKHTITMIRSASPILAEMESTGTLKIVGGVYNMSTGKVSLLP